MTAIVEPRKTLGRYEIIGEIARGAMGVVYKARDPLIDRTVAIRSSIVQHTAEVFEPDVFIVDKEPLGLRGEARSTLELLRARGTRCILGLRDVMDDPQVLVEEGLESALRVLLQPAGSRIGTLEMTPALADHRPPPAVEACAYYVVGEAVGNAIKHAGCEQIDVEVRLRDDDTVVVRVSDDGRGGADVRLGSGLRGLGERVEAHGGLLVVSDGPRGGTLVEAVLPCGR